MKITRLTVLRLDSPEALPLSPLLDDVAYAGDKPTKVGLNGMVYADVTGDMLIAAQRIGEQTITSAMVDEMVRKIEREEPGLAETLRKKELRAVAKARVVKVVPITSSNATVVILNVAGELHPTTYAVGLNLDEDYVSAVLSTLNWSFEPKWTNLSARTYDVLYHITSNPEVELLADDVTVSADAVWKGVHSGMKLSTAGLRATEEHIKNAVRDDTIMCIAAAVVNDDDHTIRFKASANLVGVSLDVDDAFDIRYEAPVEIYRHALRSVCVTLDKLVTEVK